MAPTPPLDSFPRPSVAADLVLLTLTESDAITAGQSALGVVVVRRGDGVAVLPGRLLREGQTVADAVADVVTLKLGLVPDDAPTVTPLGVHDDPRRDPRGWVIALPFLGALTREARTRVTSAGAEVLPLGGGPRSGAPLLPEPLGYDHGAMVRTALAEARSRYERSPDPLGLLDPPFRLSTLRQAHEAVLDAGLRRDTFNRRMREHLEPGRDAVGAELTTSATPGRPAQLFTRRTEPTTGEQHFPLPREG